MDLTESLGAKCTVLYNYNINTMSLPCFEAYYFSTLYGDLNKSLYASITDYALFHIHHLSPRSISLY